MTKRSILIMAALVWVADVRINAGPAVSAIPAVVPVAAAAAPTIDVKALSHAIVHQLRPWVPTTVTLATLNNEALRIAVACSTATTADNLDAALIAAISGDAALGLTSTTIINGVASQIVLAIYPKPGGKASLYYTDLSPDSWGLLTLWSGAKLLNPFTINTTTKQLTSSSSTSDGYIEIGFIERYVTRGGVYASGENPENFDEFYFVHFWDPLRYQPDITASFGYVFAGGNTANTLTASTIVGSSDIYGEASVGLPLFRKCSIDYNWKQQITAEISGGFATDRNFDVVHPEIFLGLGYQLKCPNFIGTTNVPILWFGRVGAGRIDFPTTTGSSVAFADVGGLSVPEFSHKWVPAMGTTIVLPVTSGVFLQAGGNAYFSQAPASWNITLGVTLDLTKLAKGLGTALGTSP